MDDDVKEDIRKGLTAKRKYLSIKYHWNENGSRLNDEQHTKSKWYYFHSYEVQLLQESLQSVINQLHCQTRIVDLGSGDAIKSRIVINQMLRKRKDIIYNPVDYSAAHLYQMVQKMKDEYGEELSIQTFACDCLEAMKSIRKFPGSKLFLMFGSFLMNLRHDDQIQILRAMASDMNDDDRLFLTVDGTDSDRKREIELAYLDPDGYSGRFHTNAIEWLNDEFKGNIDVSKFAYNNNLVVNKSPDSCSYIEIWMEALVECEFYIEELKVKMNFEKGEKLYFHEGPEYSCKYTVEQIKYICEKGSFEVVDYWANEHAIGVLLQKKVNP